MAPLPLGKEIHCQDRPIKFKIFVGTEENHSGLSEMANANLGYEFDIEYKMGSENKVVDGHSRM